MTGNGVRRETRFRAVARGSAPSLSKRALRPAAENKEPASLATKDCLLPSKACITAQPVSPSPESSKVKWRSEYCPSIARFVP